MRLGIFRRLFRKKIEDFLIDLLKHMESKAVVEFVLKRMSIITLLKRAIGQNNYHKYISGTNIETLLQGSSKGLYFKIITDVKQFIVLGKLWGFLKLK